MAYEKYVWRIKYREKFSRYESTYIDALVRLASLDTDKKYNKILDVACGNARLHPFLRKLGYDIVGIDINRELIEEAKELNTGYENKYIVMDMRDLNFRNEFDIILNWFDSFGYFSDKENENVLKKLYEALKPGGLLILDLPNRIYREHNLETEIKTFFEEGDILQFVKSIYNSETKREEMLIEIFKKEGNLFRKVREDKISFRLYTMEEMVDMLRRCGFGILRILKGYEFREFKSSDERMVVVAVKI